MLSEKKKDLDVEAAKPASQKQLDLLSKWKIDYDAAISKGAAHQLLEAKIHNRAQDLTQPATEKQILLLKKWEIEYVSDIIKGEASELLTKKGHYEKSAAEPATQRQKDLLARLKINFSKDITKGQVTEIMNQQQKAQKCKSAAPATEKQLEALKKLGYKVSGTITKNDASKTIGTFQKSKCTSALPTALDEIKKFKLPANRKLTTNEQYILLAQQSYQAKKDIDDVQIAKDLLISKNTKIKIIDSIKRHNPSHTGDIGYAQATVKKALSLIEEQGINISKPKIRKR